MKVAIISDTHDNISNLKRALVWFKKQGISLIIHCGDICAPLILTEILGQNFQIYFVCGNVDDCKQLAEAVEKLKGIKFFGKFGEIKLNNKKIAFIHKPDEARKLAESGNYDLVFYGHTHQPWIERLRVKNKKSKFVYLANPGNLAGMFYKATFAVYDSVADKLELKILERV